MTTKNVSLAYGQNPLTLEIPEPAIVLESNTLPAITDNQAGIESALNQPIGCEVLEKKVMQAKSVCILVSDETRRYPKNAMLKAILKRISPPLPAEAITILIAAGNHNPTTIAQAGIAPDWTQRFQVAFHSSTKSPTQSMGLGIRRDRWDILKHAWGVIKQRDPTMWSVILEHLYALKRCHYKLNRLVTEADLVIGTGQIKPHYFYGYSGGSKSILPGAASRFTIGSNHFMKWHPSARLGLVEKNWVRMESEDCVHRLNDVFILNCVTRSDGKPVGFVAGDVIAAHRQGVKMAGKIAEVKSQPSDIVIISGAYPVTLSVYQTMKLIPPAARLVKPSGVIIVAAEVPQGIDQLVIINEVMFKLGMKHLLPTGTALYLVSSLPEREVRRTHFQYAPDIHTALEWAYNKCGRQATLTIIPNGNDIVPLVPGAT